MTTQVSSLPEFSCQPLDRFGAISVQGKDAERFLQGQISANVAHATQQFAPYGVFCTPKGRVIANVQLIRKEAEHYWIVCHESLIEGLLAHLKKYAVFFKADLDRHPVFFYGVFGTSSAIKQHLSLAEVPQHANEVVNGQNALLIKVAGNHRWLLLKETPLPDDLLTKNDERQDWWQEEARQGIAWLDDSQSDKWLPQMLNWECLGGISFKKGCYTGQEVVARAHYRGQVKKRLAHFSLNQESDIKVGDSVIDNLTEKSVGTVIAAENGKSATEILAVVSLTEEPRTLTVNDIELISKPLPYLLERVDPETRLAETLENTF